MQVGVVWMASGIVSLSLNGNINVFNPTVPRPIKVIAGHQVAITAFHVDQAQGKLYSGSFDGVVSARSIETSENVKVASENKKSVNGAAHGNKIVGLARIGDFLFSAGWDDSIKIADPVKNEYIGSVAVVGQPAQLSGNSAAGKIYFI